VLVEIDLKQNTRMKERVTAIHPERFRFHVDILLSPTRLSCPTHVRADRIEMIARFLEADNGERSVAESVRRVSDFGWSIASGEQSGAKQFKEEERIIRRAVDDASLCSSPRAVLPRAMRTSRCGLGARQKARNPCLGL